MNATPVNSRSPVRLLGAVAVAGAVAAGALCVSATAARTPNRTEARDIRAVVLKGCNREYDCSGVKRIRVSTANPRFAIGSGVTDFSDYTAIVRRSRPGSRDWRIRFVAGGGVPDCRAMLRVVPRAVLRDLRVYGLDATGASRLGC